MWKVCKNKWLCKGGGVCLEKYQYETCIAHSICHSRREEGTDHIMHSRLISFLETGFLPRGRICLGTQRFTMLEGKHSWTVASCHYNGPEMFQLHISNPKEHCSQKTWMPLFQRNFNIFMGTWRRMPQGTNPSFLQSFLEYEFGWFHLPENIKSCSQPTYTQRSAIQFSFISLPIAPNVFSETGELEILQGRDPIGHTWGHTNSRYCDSNHCITGQAEWGQQEL